ncbi:MAG: PAS domain-containing protein, partial [Chloroflexi bacterium]|nr:PAS domain-containing protein [Chloroflexota bacterium]
MVRKDLLIVIAAILASMLVIIYVSSHLILLGSFARLEEEDIQKDVQRALAQLSEDQRKLNTIARDYATWDDTYAFVAGAETNFVQVNFTDATYQNLHLNLILIANIAGQIVYGSGYDLAEGQPVPVPASLLNHITLSDQLLDHTTTDSDLTGIVLLPEGPMVVTSRPILTSNAEGPVHGTLIMGHFLSAEEVEQYAEITQLSLAFRRIDDSQLPADFAVAQANLSPAAPTFIRPLDAESIAGYSLVMDLYGQPAMLLRVNGPRDIYVEGQNSLNYFILSFIVVALLFGMALYTAVDRLLLSRREQQATAAKYQTLVEQIPAITYIAALDGTNSPLYVSPQIKTMLGFSAEEWLRDTTFWVKQIHPEDRERMQLELSRANSLGKPVHGDYRFITKDGHTVWMHDDAMILKDAQDQPEALQGILLDITERKRAEEEIQRRANELSALYELSRALVDAADLDSILEIVTHRSVEHIRVTFSRIILLEGAEFVTRAAYPIRVLEQELPVGVHEPVANLPFCQRLLERDEVTILYADNAEMSEHERNALFLGLAQTLCCVPLRVGTGRPNSSHILGLLILGEARQEERETFTPEKIRLARSIGDQTANTIRRMWLRTQTERRMQHLTALRDIDRAITSSFDLHLSLTTLLNHVIAQLGVDAADVLLFNGGAQTLEFAAGRGFRTTAFEHAVLRLGEGYAGRAALERVVVHIPHLARQHDNPRLARVLADEVFVDYYGVPLIAKGQVKG